MPEKLTEVERGQLMSYLLNNYIEKTFHIADVPFILRSLTVSDQLAAKQEMGAVMGSRALIDNEFTIKLLKRSLIMFNDQTFATPNDAETFLRNMGDQLLDRIAVASQKLVTELKELLTKSDDFSESPSPSID